MINDIMTRLLEQFSIELKSSKLAMHAFAKAMEDHIIWKGSPKGKAYFKAHPIKRKDILNRLKQRR